MKRPASSSNGQLAKARAMDPSIIIHPDDHITFDEASKTYAFVDENGRVYGSPRPWMNQPWVKVKHDDPRFGGRIFYYFNEVTEESVWEDPTNGAHR